VAVRVASSVWWLRQLARSLARATAASAAACTTMNSVISWPAMAPWTMWA
jgi:hypothetical protein